MSILQRGQRAPLTTFTPATRFTLKTELPLPTPPDISIFGLDESRRLADDRYFVFYNQPSNPERAIVMNEQTQVFTVDLALVPLSVHRLLLTATSDDQVFSAMHRGHATLSVSGQEVLRFEVSGSDFQAERAVMLLELYLHGGAWRIAGVGQGFAGGLQALLESLGGEALEPVSDPAPALLVPEPAADLTKLESRPRRERRGREVPPVWQDQWRLPAPGAAGLAWPVRRLCSAP